MKPHRRALLKGMMAGSAIAAVGLPKISFAKPQAPAARDVVLVGCGGIDAGFAAGAGEAGALKPRNLGAGSLPDLAATRALFESCRGKRLVGLMEDGAYVLFSEMARDAGARLVFEGQHSIAADGRLSRHAFSSAAGFHGSAEPLAAALSATDAAFVIAEAPVGGGGRVVRGGDWSRLGFDSFHVADEVPTWLHLSGVSRQEGCDALGVAAVQTEPLRCWPTYVPTASASAAGWSAILGNTLARLAAGGEENRQPCIRQAFIRRAEALDDFAAHDSYVSFVMEA
ncbi:MAG: hypothetical protein HZC23_02635 [Rhodocyclales bacterium]|nr:hypothetical protein [Rhodocyclales bacterium]